MARELWSGDHPVLEALRARRASGSRPGDRSDGHKIGLAVEGGGMRGVVSAGMMVALDDLGYADTFDAVYGASAGATNAAYFLSSRGHGWYPLSIYWEDLNDPRFVKLGRYLTGGSIMDHVYLFDTVVETSTPLDYEAVLSSPIPLHVAVTLVDEARSEVVTDFRSREDLKAALRASTWLPLALRGTTTFRGRRAVDGAVLMPHPFAAALADGCTHVLSLSTRPMRPPRSRPTVLQYLICRHLERIRPGLGREYLAALGRYREQRRWLQRSMTQPDGPPFVLDLAPPPATPMVKHLQLDAGRLIEAARAAYRLMYCAMERIDVADAQNGRIRVIPRFTIVRDGDVGSGHSGHVADLPGQAGT